MKSAILIILVLFLSCSKNGDNYVGNYITSSKEDYIIIKKAGDEGCFVTIGHHDNSNSIYCTFKNGCFFTGTRG